MKNKLQAGFLVMVLAAGPAALAQTSQTPTRPSVWDGVYTQAQAQRGRGQYVQHCAMCHGAYLEGNGEAPPLTGEFIPDWAGMTLADLDDKIAATMPLNAPGTLQPQAAADILAYILERNNFPAGTNELPIDADSLKAVSFDAFKPKPAPTPMPKKKR